MAELTGKAISGISGPKIHFLSETIHPDLKTPQGFLHRLLKSPADRHRFTDRFHLGR